MEEVYTPAKVLIKRLEDIGRVKEKLSQLMMDDIFDDLSKHSEYWRSTDELANEKLHDIRMRLGCFETHLAEIWNILENDD